MLLTSYNICHYLIDKGYIDKSTIVDGNFTVRMSHSRNNSFVVNKEFDNSFFIKQVSTFEQDKIRTLRNEATCYWLANNEPEFALLKSFLPKYFDYDTKHHILTIGFIPDSIDLDDFYHRHQQFPLALAEKQAELLCSIHQNIFEKIIDSPSEKLFQKGLPMVFFMVGKGNHAWLEDRTPAVKEMMQLITHDGEYVALLESIKDEWEVDSLIHGDIKTTNFMINENCLNSGEFDLRILDWEIADLGDSMWDVAAVLQGYLVMWVFRKTAGEQGHLSSYGKPIGFELEEMQPSIQHFWKRYVELMGFSSEEQEAKLLKATRYCALKLIHSCLESSQYSPKLPPQSAMMLQLSLNILKSQKEAIRSLFDLKVTEVYSES